MQFKSTYICSSLMLLSFNMNIVSSIRKPACKYNSCISFNHSLCPYSSTSSLVRVLNILNFLIYDAMLIKLCRPDPVKPTNTACSPVFVSIRSIRNKCFNE